jgi:hypothetical protein
MLGRHTCHCTSAVPCTGTRRCPKPSPDDRSFDTALVHTYTLGLVLAPAPAVQHGQIVPDGTRVQVLYQQNCVGSSSTSTAVRVPQYESCTLYTSPLHLAPSHLISSHLMPFRIHTPVLRAKPTTPCWGFAQWHSLDVLVTALGDSHCPALVALLQGADRFLPGVFLLRWANDSEGLLGCMEWYLYVTRIVLCLVTASDCPRPCPRTWPTNAAVLILKVPYVPLQYITTVYCTVCDTVSVGAVRYSFSYIIVLLMSCPVLVCWYPCLPPEYFFRPRESRAEHRS